MTCELIDKRGCAQVLGVSLSMFTTGVPVVWSFPAPTRRGNAHYWDKADVERWGKNNDAKTVFGDAARKKRAGSSPRADRSVADAADVQAALVLSRDFLCGRFLPPESAKRRAYKRLISRYTKPTTTRVRTPNHW
ncbi:MAG: hypothetical protein CTY21_09430 [Methylomonas sp.]|nr:MAG: hypothetical protein CTY21_09430 [Methylomonas sp.]